jgi:hypothetical protein
MSNLACNSEGESLRCANFLGQPQVWMVLGMVMTAGILASNRFRSCHKRIKYGLQTYCNPASDGLRWVSTVVMDRGLGGFSDGAAFSIGCDCVTNGFAIAGAG